MWTTRVAARRARVRRAEPGRLLHVRDRPRVGARDPPARRHASPPATTSACTAATGCASRAAATPRASRACSTAGSYGIDGTLLRGARSAVAFRRAASERSTCAPCAARPGPASCSLNLDPDAEPLRDYLGVIPEHLDPYHFEEWKVAFDATIEIECNWKTSVDAFNEAYHLSATHTWTLEFSDDVNTLYDCYDKHTRMIFPEVQASPRHPGAGTVTPRHPRPVPGARRRRRRELHGRARRGAHRVRRRDPQDGPGARLRLLRAERSPDVRRLPLHDVPERHLQHPLAVRLGVHAPAAPGRPEQDVLRLLEPRAHAGAGDPAPREAALPHRGRRHARGQVRGRRPARRGPLQPAAHPGGHALGARSAACTSATQEVRIRHFHRTLEQLSRSASAW